MPAASTSPADLRAGLSLQRMFADPPLIGSPPNRLAFARDGAAVAWLRGSERDSEVLDLWILRLPGGTPEPLVKTADLTDVSAIRVSDAERAVNERLRLHQAGITGFAWCGPDSSRLVFPLSGDLYLVQTNSASQVERLTTDGVAKLDPRCSPNGTFVTFVRAGELFVLDLRTREERKLTSGASDAISNGVAEFVAQEEMDRHHGYFWSADEAWLAYLRVDETPVSLKVRAKIHADRTEMQAQRYPAAGEPNARVSLNVIQLATGRDILVPLPAHDGYVARVNWSKDRARLWVQWQSRDQKRLLLFEADAPAFVPRLALTETDDAWVELTDDFRPLPGGDAFLWTSEREGRRQLYRVERQGEGWNPIRVTSSPDPVVRILGSDSDGGRVFFLRATDLARQQHVFAMSARGGAELQVTAEPGWHEAVFSESGARFSDTFSTFERPPRVDVRDDHGRVIGVVDANPAEELLGVPAPETRWVQVETEDGTLLQGVVMPPLGMEPGRRYPVLVHVYGGPGAQLATHRFMRQRPFHIYLTENGYGVFLLDGRGTPHRDRAFSRAIHRRLGDVEVEDQLRGARWLQAQPWVDANRIGIWGWSYGGYASLMAILRKDTPFRAAAAVAPVTDWRLYDTHYTERFLGMPGGAGDSYDRADVLSRARRLDRPLLVVHGMADDNVLFEHSLRLVETLQQSAVPFELMVYPGKAHGLDGRNTQWHVFRTLTDFFGRALGEGANPHP